MRIQTRLYTKCQNLLRHYSNFQYKPHLVRDHWEPVVGLEIHAQISSATKLFSRVSTRYGAPPNTQVGIFESAHPGTLPVLNRRCVEAGVKTALAFGCTVNKWSAFDRKHYFYPDLPGTVDLNRAGQPLMELVFAPGLHNGEEAVAMVKEVALILTRIGTCNCRMHEGSLRVDANISVHRPDEPLGTRTEVKNLNSIRSLSKAVDFEIQRQINILESGGRIINETRSFDTLSNETISMRDKEVTQDYRFMPEPNLLPLRLHDSLEPTCQYDGSLDINDVRATMPELPEATRQRLMSDYEVTLENAILLVNNGDLLDYYMAAMAVSNRSSRLVCNLLLNNLMGFLNSINADIKDSPLSASAFGEIVDLQQSGQISNTVSNLVMNAICIEGDLRAPTQIVIDNNWFQLSAEDALEEIVDKVLSENGQLIEKYKKSKKKKKLFNVIVQRIKDASENRANMKIISDIVLKKLGS
nr:LOW QUALITY PROTEIN: glutamyl-tRNA(Gln) amidotransferase subunit B, mitochondrial-like [Procambarus clarkii]